MIELFSRKPDAITLREGTHLTPIPLNEEISSLSAILLNDDYYQFIHQGKLNIDGLPTLAHTHLIPLKIRAWLDLSSQRALGIHVDESDIRKHRNDTIRLFQLLSPDEQIFLPPFILQDMLTFIEKMKKTTIDFRSLGIVGAHFNDFIEVLSSVYCQKTHENSF